MREIINFIVERQFIIKTEYGLHTFWAIKTYNKIFYHATSNKKNKIMMMIVILKIIIIIIIIIIINLSILLV